MSDPTSPDPTLFPAIKALDDPANFDAGGGGGYEGAIIQLGDSYVDLETYRTLLKAEFIAAAVEMQRAFKAAQDLIHVQHQTILDLQSAIEAVCDADPTEDIWPGDAPAKGELN